MRPPRITNKNMSEVQKTIYNQMIEQKRLSCMPLFNQGEERQKRTDEMKERVLLVFLDTLREKAFVKSTNSVTDDVEELNPVVEDMEGIIKISGEWDREDLKDLIVSRAG